MLDNPARLCQLGVNLVTRTLFRVLARGCHRTFLTIAANYRDLKG
jgi:hypothetical protein